ncbi:hypothetical protein [Halanaerobacter jeridensis]|uniref:Uncharacterized protein n=1 Tax=Halanaerobacter jeridensis TaxID=706427 RepID=A0A939BQC9_9FIRM|nr:hypothetical protein [Halanaerobacter jeridensis]MBM7558157.1 hypothetical protein [Halanaerobacter jeridensis]
METININEDMSFEELQNCIVSKSKETILNETIDELEYYEEKYEMQSKEFYDLYNEGELDPHNSDYRRWITVIERYCKNQNVKPKAINL